MKFDLSGNPEFGDLTVALGQGESFWAEAGAMSRMSSYMELRTRVVGGLFKAMMRKLFGGESFFKSDAFLENFDNPTALIRKALGHGNRFVEIFRGFDVALTLTNTSLHSEVTVRLKSEPQG